MYRPLITILFAIAVVLVEPIGVTDAETLTSENQARDARLEAAKAARKAIETHEEAVASSVADLLEQLETAIAKVPSESLEQEQLTLEYLKAIAVALREQSEQVLMKRDAYASEFTSMQAALESAPTAFRGAGKAFREYAEEEPFEDIGAVYLSLAETWESLADETEKRAATDAGPTIDEWDATCRYIASIGLFATRLEEHLDAFPNADAVSRRRQYSEELKGLIRQFEELKRLLRQFNAQLTTDALASSLRGETSEVKTTVPVQFVSQQKPAIAGVQRTASRSLHPTPSPRLATTNYGPIPTERSTSEETFDLGGTAVEAAPLNVAKSQRPMDSVPHQQATATARPPASNHRTPAHHAGYYFSYR